MAIRHLKYIATHRQNDNDERSVDFFKTWNEYKNGFGSVAGGFWLGNDKVHELTKRQDLMIRFDLEDWNGIRFYAEYAKIYIDDVSKKYRAHVGSYSGTTGDAFTYVNTYKFSTKYHDNDASSGTCASAYHGARWYVDCHSFNLNERQWSSGTICTYTPVGFISWTPYSHFERQR